MVINGDRASEHHQGRATELPPIRQSQRTFLESSKIRNHSPGKPNLGLPVGEWGLWSVVYTNSHGHFKLPKYVTVDSLKSIRPSPAWHWIGGYQPSFWGLPFSSCHHASQRGIIGVVATPPTYSTGTTRYALEILAREVEWEAENDFLLPCPVVHAWLSSLPGPWRGRAQSCYRETLSGRLKAQLSQ